MGQSSTAKKRLPRDAVSKVAQQRLGVLEPARELGNVAEQRRREMGWMAFVSLFVLWICFYQFRTMLVIILRDPSFSDLPGSLNLAFFTAKGRIFLAMCSCVGASLPAFLFSVTVVPMPMPLDRDLDFVAAGSASIRVGQRTESSAGQLHLPRGAVGIGTLDEVPDVDTRDPELVQDFVDHVRQAYGEPGRDLPPGAP